MRTESPPSRPASSSNLSAHRRSLGVLVARTCLLRSRVGEPRGRGGSVAFWLGYTLLGRGYRLLAPSELRRRATWRLAVGAPPEHCATSPDGMVVQLHASHSRESAQIGTSRPRLAVEL